MVNLKNLWVLCDFIELQGVVFNQIKVIHCDYVKLIVNQNIRTFSLFFSSLKLEIDQGISNCHRLRI